ncbi:hypothetical protein KN815_21260 [Streptomyces sp. 4503]|uniref:Secreted protein n=1 Tax=Streptomyces niphimycinicus TaxID=2842201 RepID=A0ABS6CHU3_9ACTN|nr:hypothetical protein [Streptomyces niphimycinicus]MBU3866501.1 hypothetical protein [Streptomyces niphimycinicus]
MHSLSAVVLMVMAAIGLWILTGFWSGKDRDTAIPPPEPLADLQLSPEQQQSLRHAEDVLVRRCMRDRGMDFHVAGTAEAPASLPNPYGLLDSAEVAERGYGLHGAAPVPSDPRLTDRERDALFGTEASQKTIPLAEGGELVVHTDGCFYQAQTELYGEDWKRLLHGEETLAAKIVARVNRDPRVNATQHTWARCMGRAGYSVTTLEDVRPDAMRRMGGGLGPSGRRDRVQRALGPGGQGRRLPEAGTRRARDPGRAEGCGAVGRPRSPARSRRAEDAAR